MKKKRIVLAVSALTLIASIIIDIIALYSPNGPDISLIWNRILSVIITICITCNIDACAHGYTKEEPVKIIDYSIYTILLVSFIWFPTTASILTKHGQPIDDSTKFPVVINSVAGFMQAEFFIMTLISIGFLITWIASNRKLLICVLFTICSIYCFRGTINHKIDQINSSGGAPK